MTIRDIMHEIDREQGRSDKTIADATAFADKMLPEGPAILDRELAPHEIDAARIEIRKLRAESEKMAKQIVDAFKAKQRRNN